MGEISVFAPSVANLWAVIKSYGIDPKSLFSEHDVNLEFPIDSGSRLSYQKIDEIRARAAALSADEAFGLRTATFMHPSHLGALGFSWLASRTLRIALHRWQRYIRMLNRYAQLKLTENKSLLTLEFTIDLPSRNLIVRDDCSTATLVEMMRYNYGPHLELHTIELTRPQPEDTGPWDEYFACDLRYGMPRNRIRVRAEHADMVLPSANPHLALLNEEMVIRYLDQLDRDDFPGLVRAEIVHQLPCGHCEQAKVAEALHITPRTLRRRLLASDTSFKALLLEVRQDLSEHLVYDEGLSLTQISYQLGFSELSSFTRAFRKWNGVSPTQARASASVPASAAQKIGRIGSGHNMEN